MAASHYTGLTAVADVIKDLDTQIAVSKLLEATVGRTWWMCFWSWHHSQCSQSQPMALIGVAAALGEGLSMTSRLLKHKGGKVPYGKAELLTIAKSCVSWAEPGLGFKHVLKCFNMSWKWTNHFLKLCDWVLSMWLCYLFEFNMISYLNNACKYLTQYSACMNSFKMSCLF